MRRVMAVVALSILLAGCAAQAASNGPTQPTRAEPTVEDRLQAMEVQQKTILTAIKAVEDRQRKLEDRLKDLEQKIGELEAAQRSLKLEQESLRSELRTLSWFGSNAGRPDVRSTAAASAAKCEDPYTILQKKLEQIEGTPTNAGFAQLVDLALAEYEACLRGNR